MLIEHINDQFQAQKKIPPWLLKSRLDEMKAKIGKGITLWLLKSRLDETKVEIGKGIMLIASSLQPWKCTDCDPSKCKVSK